MIWSCCGRTLNLASVVVYNPTTRVISATVAKSLHLPDNPDKAVVEVYTV